MKPTFLAALLLIAVPTIAAAGTGPSRTPNGYSSKPSAFDPYDRDDRRETRSDERHPGYGDPDRGRHHFHKPRPPVSRC